MSVTLHTTAGTIKIEVFCESVPKTAEVTNDPSPSNSTAPAHILVVTQYLT